MFTCPFDYTQAKNNNWNWLDEWLELSWEKTEKHFRNNLLIGFKSISSQSVVLEVFSYIHLLLYGEARELKSSADKLRIKSLDEILLFKIEKYFTEDNLWEQKNLLIENEKYEK